MARKPSNTPLYELMLRSRAGVAGGPKKTIRESPTRSSGQGRAIRLPVGYVWLGAAGAVLVVVAAFSTGYLRGHREATTTLERQWLQTHQQSMPVPPPEIAPGVPGATIPPAAAPDGNDIVAAAVVGRAVRSDAEAPIQSDPRVKGMNYFVLIHTRLENAIRLARFCRDLGVDAYVVPAKNVSLYHMVIVLPGYARGERSVEPVRFLEQRIAEVVRKWRLQVNSRDDLAYYPQRFDG